MTTKATLGEIPALIIQADETPRPFLLWMHGRTADKEIDPGRYLRYARAGVNVCAVDLPGHGERFDAALQGPDTLFAVITQMAAEVDSIVDSLQEWLNFREQQMAIGGMSAGGMAAILRLTKVHQFSAAVLEATMGQWRLSRHHSIFESLTDEEFDAVNPVNHITNWLEIPLIAFHSRHDEWIPYASQEEFIARLKQRYENPEKIEFVTFDHTGAPKEHLGFGRESAFVKEIQVEFINRVFQSNMELP